MASRNGLPFLALGCMLVMVIPIAAFPSPSASTLLKPPTASSQIYSSGIRLKAQIDSKETKPFLLSRSLLSGVIFLTGVITPGAGWAAERGQVLFDNNCSSCHVGGGNVIGYARGKTLQADALKKNKYDTKQSIVNLLEQGKGVMPKYSSYVRKNGEVAPARLSTQEMESVANYVLQQAAAGWK